MRGGEGLYSESSTPHQAPALFTETRRRLLVKIDGKDIQQTIAGIQAFLVQTRDDMPFEYRFRRRLQQDVYNSEIVGATS